MVVKCIYVNKNMKKLIQIFLKHLKVMMNPVHHVARNAFAVDAPGVTMGPISRFGTLEMTVPRRSRPILDRLLDADGGLSAKAGALRLARAFEREGRADPGGRLEGRCAPAVAAAFAPLQARLAERLGARFAVVSVEGWANDRLQVSAL